MITKSQLKAQIEKFPEEFSIDQLIDHLILMEKINRGVDQSENNQVISDSDMDNEIDSWFK